MIASCPEMLLPNKRHQERIPRRLSLWQRKLCAQIYGPPWEFYPCNIGRVQWRDGLVVGRRTCDLRVARSRPGRDAAAQQPRQVVHTLLPLSPSSIIWYQRKLGSKQLYHVVHQPVSRGLAVFADAWLSGWLAEISADLWQTVAH